MRRRRRLPGFPRRRVARLANGLRVVTLEQRHLHRTALALVSRAGSIYESEDDNGLSHFVEHMLFRGTREHPRHHAFHGAVEALGGTLQAVTYCDHTLYELYLPPRSTLEGIALLSEIVRGPTFSGIGLEREVIRAELLDDVGDHGDDRNPDTLVRKLLFPDHPYGRPVAGPPDRPDRFGLRDCRRFVRRHLTGENLVLAAAGPLDADAIVTAARRSFGTVPPGVRLDVARPPVARERFRYVHRPEPGGARVDVRIDLCAPGRGAREYPALQVLLRILDDGMATRLHRRVVDDRGLAYEVFAEVDPVGEVSVFEVGAAVAPERAVDLVRELVRILEGLVGRPPTEAEVDRARRRHVWELEAAMDDARAMAAWFGEAELAGLGRDLEERIDVIRSVRRSAVRDAARALLGSSGAAVTVGPLRRLEQRRVRKLLDGIG